MKGNSSSLRSLAVLVAVLFLGLLVTAAAPGPAPAHVPPRGPRPDPVQVVNTARHPVPTTVVGTATVDGAVQAQQLGPWNVGLVGTPSVNIANAAVPVTGTVHVDNLPGGTPVRGRLHIIGVTPGPDAAVSEVPPDTVVTDIMVLMKGSSGVSCVFMIVDTTSAPDVLFAYELPQAELHSVRLTTGLRGPLTLRISAIGSGVGCHGDLVWTGVSL